MSKGSYMPDKEADQVLWSANFVATVTPNIASYGIPATMMTHFTALNDALQTAWANANLINSRTRGSIADKNKALADMKAAARPMVGLIQSTPGVSDQMKIDAGVTVRKTKPTPSPVPSQKPVIVVTGVDGRTVSIELRQDSTRRGKPAKVASATIMTATGTNPPMTMDGWQLYSATGKTAMDVAFPPSSAGDTVWITAFWSNAAQESGPASTPLPVNLPAGGVMTIEGKESIRLKAA